VSLLNWDFIRNRKFHVLLIILTGIAAYSNTFHVPFHWDDLTYINENPVINNIGYFFSPSKASELQFYKQFIQRYITYLTFALNYTLDGYNVTGYHIANLIIHLLNALLVYFLVCLTFETPALKKSTVRDQAGITAVFAAIMFVSHPLQTMAVTYIYQRLASLVTFFYLLSLISYIKSRQSRKTVNSVLFYMISLLSAVLAMKAKENAFTLPFAIALFEFFFFEGKIKTRFTRLIPLLLTLLIIPLSLLGDAGKDNMRLHLDNSVTSDVYFFTQFRVLVMYLRLLFFPVQQSLIYDFPVSRSFFEVKVVLSFLLLLAIFFFGVFLFISSRTGHPERRIGAFGIFWFFITHAVESSVVPLLIAQEYRMYLPSIGLFIVIAGGISLMLNKSGITRTVAISIVVAVPLILGVATYVRNNVWQSRLGLWEDVIQKAPNDPYSNFNLGFAYTENGLIDKSKKYYENAVKLKPDYARAYNNLGCVYGQKGDPDKAIGLLLFALSKEPTLAIAHYNLGLAYILKGLPDKAETHFRTALKLNPNLQGARKILTRIERKRN
jgi:tetratricopeptide (TPR) repeat protein